MRIPLLLLALLGLVVVLLAIRELVRRPDLGAWPHKLFTIVAVVVGISTQSELVPAGKYLRLGIVGLCALLALFVLTGPADWRSPARRARCWAAGLVFLLWADLFFTNAVLNSGSQLTALAERLAPGLFWLAILLLWLGGGLRRDLLAVVLALAVGLVSLVTPLVPDGVWPCTTFKCGLFGELVSGPFSSENYPAMLAALCLVLVLTCRVGPLRWTGALLSGGLLLATGGRSSLIGVGVGLVVLTVVWLVGRRSRTGLAALISLALPALFVITGLSLVYLSSTQDLSNRGAIWVKARDSLSGHEVFGLGISRWSGYGRHEAISQHFPHSLYLLILFSGGLVALTLFTAAIAASLLDSAAGHRDLAGSAAYAAIYLTIGLSEIVTNVMTVDGLTWALLPLLAVASTPPVHEVPQASRNRGLPQQLTSSRR